MVEHPKSMLAKPSPRPDGTPCTYIHALIVDLPEDVPVGLRGLRPLLLDDVDAGEAVQRSDVLSANIMLRVNFGTIQVCRNVLQYC